MDELYDKLIAVRLSKSQLERLDEICKRQDRTRSQWVRMKIEHHLRHCESKEEINQP